MLDDAQAAATQVDNVLEVNNIEVIYNHVILVLKGVSLNVPKGGITALLGGDLLGRAVDMHVRSPLRGRVVPQMRREGSGRPNPARIQIEKLCLHPPCAVAIFRCLW